ncbi:MAG: FAD-dependent monooxygenase [Actinobacteria bacterium]|nr:FAD-dependent monooxygenase [Actinomycetota bacterium]
MKIACVGGGPAGLYFSLLLKLRQPQHEITIYERGAPGVTRGWGVVFWNDLLDQLRDADPESAAQIAQAAFPWSNEIVDVGGTQILHGVSQGYGMKRRLLLDILARRAEQAGVRIEYHHEVTSAAQLPDADLIVACDGVNSRLRAEASGIQTDEQPGTNKYIWLGTEKVFSTFTFPFVHTSSGWVWAHAYGVDAGSSTFIVECAQETWDGLGFAAMSQAECLAVLEKIFAAQLDGHQLIGTSPDGLNAQWVNFRTITNNRWYDGRVVLAGDAAHTTHFSVGSGTRLAIEDAIALAGRLQRDEEVPVALGAYERERRETILRTQLASRYSAQWFENVPRYIGLGPRQFSALMRRRRSPLMPRISPQLYYWSWPTSREPPFVDTLRRLAGPPAVKVYGWLRQLQSRAKN